MHKKNCGYQDGKGFGGAIFEIMMIKSSLADHADCGELNTKKFARSAKSA